MRFSWPAVGAYKHLHMKPHGPAEFHGPAARFPSDAVPAGPSAASVCNITRRQEETNTVNTTHNRKKHYHITKHRPKLHNTQYIAILSPQNCIHWQLKYHNVLCVSENGKCDWKPITQYNQPYDKAQSQIRFALISKIDSLWPFWGFVTGLKRWPFPNFKYFNYKQSYLTSSVSWLR